MKEKPILENIPSSQDVFSIAIVTSLFNESVTEKLKTGAIARLKELGFQDHHILLVDVPGAFELPVTVQRIALKGLAEVIITLGAVIRGETTHYDYVCQQVSAGCQQVALTHQLPVIFGVLTTENVEQAMARAGGHEGHKGREAADCAVHMRRVFQRLYL